MFPQPPQSETPNATFVCARGPRKAPGRLFVVVCLFILEMKMDLYVDVLGAGSQLIPVHLAEYREGRRDWSRVFAGRCPCSGWTCTYCLNPFSPCRGPGGGQGKYVHLEGLEASRLQIKALDWSWEQKLIYLCSLSFFPPSKLMHSYNFSPFTKRFVVVVNPSCDNDSSHPPSPSA